MREQKGAITADQLTALHQSITNSRVTQNVVNKKVFCYFGYFYTTLSTPELGRMINRDHATVIAHANQVDFWLGKGLTGKGYECCDQVRLIEGVMRNK